MPCKCMGICVNVISLYQYYQSLQNLYWKDGLDHSYHLMYHMTDLIEFYKSYSRKTKDLLNVNIL